MNKLLIVDNNEKNLDLISKSLQSSSYAIYTAQSGKMAVAKAKILKPDLIITDDDLSDMSGFDFCRTIKNDPLTNNCLVLMMLTVETKDTILRSLYSSSDDYLIKNFNSTIITSKVSSLLRVKHLNDTLSQQYAELKEKDELINFQLNMAKQVQRSIIKKIDSSFDKLSIYSEYIPALEIGGDFFSAKQIDENHVGIILGDVSGHGISAALLTSMLFLMYNNLCYQYLNPAELLNVMNEQFCRIFDDSDTHMYACVVYAVVDTLNKTIEFANGGENYPVIVNKKKNEITEIQVVGTPVGMLSLSTYTSVSASYDEDDIMLLHTDGLSDFFYKDSPEAFSNKLHKVLLESADYSLHDVSNKILSEFYTYDETKRFEADDVTMILTKL